MHDIPGSGNTLPFYAVTSEGFGTFVACSNGSTIHKCRSQGEAIELADRLNKAFNDVIYRPEPTVKKIDIRSGEDFLTHVSYGGTDPE